MRPFAASFTIVLVTVCSALVGQVCTATSLQLQHDVLPPNPAGNQPYAAIAGVGPGDRAAVVFDLRGMPGPIRVLRGGVLFGGTSLLGTVSPCTANFEVYDGLTLVPTGQVLMGPRVHVSQQPLSLAPNTVTLSDISGLNITISSGLLVVAWQMVTNPNLPPPLSTTGFGADTTLPAGSPCATRPDINLIFDVNSQQWWDISRFRISGQPFCGIAFNGNWIIRACVQLPNGAYLGTGDGLTLATGVAGAPPSAVVSKAATTGNAISIQLATPTGVHQAGFVFLTADVFPAAGPAPVPAVPGAWVGAGFQAVGPLFFDANGTIAQSLTIPPRSLDLVLLLQGAVLSTAANNRVYATSDAHAIWIY